MAATPQVIKEFKLEGCWLTGIGPIQLNAAEKNALLTFNATVRYDYISYTGTPVPGVAVAAQTFATDLKGPRHHKFNLPIFL
jgi:hypothetical protein